MSYKKVRVRSPGVTITARGMRAHVPGEPRDVTALRWDKAASDDSCRWGPSASLRHFIEGCEMLLEKGQIATLWDTLNSPEHRPADLGDDEERYIACRALRREAELGRLDGAKVAVLQRLIGGADHLRSETDHPEAHQRVRAALRADPTQSDRSLSSRSGLARSTVALIRKSMMADD
jgi:hypothetical protein